MTALNSNNAADEPESNVQQFAAAANAKNKSKIAGAAIKVGMVYRFAWRTCLGAAISAEQAAVGWAKNMAEKGAEFETKAKSGAQEKLQNSPIRNKAQEKIADLETMIDKGVNRSLNFIGVPTKKDINTLTHLIQDMADAINELAEETLKSPSKAKRSSTGTSSSKSSSSATASRESA